METYCKFFLILEIFHYLKIIANNCYLNKCKNNTKDKNMRFISYHARISS